MIVQAFQKFITINRLYSIFRFNKSLTSARKTFIERVTVAKRIYPDETIETIWSTLKKNFFDSVVVRTHLLKYNYDFLFRHAFLYKYEQYQKNNQDAIIRRFIKTHLILLKGSLVLKVKKDFPITRSACSYHNKINSYCKKIKKNFPIARSACSYDNNPCNTLSKKDKKCIQYEQIVANGYKPTAISSSGEDERLIQSTSEITNNNKETTSYNKNSVNFSSDNNASSQDNTSLIKYQNPEDVFAPYGHLWTYCENCETSIYKQYAQKNKYICKHCAFHLPMESSDRIESLIDSGTWDPTDENMVSINPYEILRICNEEFEESKLFSDSEEFEFKKEEELEDLVDSLPSDEEELDPEDLNTEESTAEQASTEESTAEQTSTEDSTAEESPAEQTSTEESTAEESIAKKYTPKELVQLFLLEEIEANAELEEKEKNLASADDEDANQNLEESEESEEDANQNSEESEESEESEKDIPYIDKLDSNQRETGLTEAIQTGIGQLDGIPVALAVMDFQFIGGSMGSVVGEKITRLIEYATNQSLPLIISCASGGARMQEGSLSLMQMAKISSVLLDYKFNNLFLVSLLTSPTTGGVTASFGMLGNIIIGEPDAYIAFAGKRVIEEVMNIIVPEGVQEAEYLFEKGSLDSIVPRNLLKGVLSELLKFHSFFPLNKNENKI